MNLANWISIFRIILVPFFIGTIVYYSPQRDYLRLLSVVIFVVAVASDGIDGFIARTRGMKTILGSFLDPIADKLLLSSSFITLALAVNLPLEIRIPLWLPILVISRDIILALGSFLIFVIAGDLRITPTILGKLTTFFQMATIISVLLQAGISPLIWTIGAFFTVISGFDYILRGTIMLNNNNLIASPKDDSKK